MVWIVFCAAVWINWFWWIRLAWINGGRSLCGTHLAETPRLCLLWHLRWPLWKPVCELHGWKPVQKHRFCRGFLRPWGASEDLHQNWRAIPERVRHWLITSRFLFLFLENNTNITTTAVRVFSRSARKKKTRWPSSTATLEIPELFSPKKRIRLTKPLPVHLYVFSSLLVVIAHFQDHKPTDAKEKERIENAKGYVSVWSLLASILNFDSFRSLLASTCGRSARSFARVWRQAAQDASRLPWREEESDLESWLHSDQRRQQRRFLVYGVRWHLRGGHFWTTGRDQLDCREDGDLRWPGSDMLSAFRRMLR